MDTDAVPTTTRDVTGATVQVRAKARKADHWSYGWHGFYFYVDYRTGETFATVREF